MYRREKVTDSLWAFVRLAFVIPWWKLEAWRRKFSTVTVKPGRTLALRAKLSRTHVWMFVVVRARMKLRW